MLNKLNWMLASLLVATSSFAQGTTPPPKNNGTSPPPKNCFDQGLEMPKNQTVGAHSYSGRIQVRGSWDVFATGSYIYWQAREENLDIGMRSNTPVPFAVPPTLDAASPSVAKVIHPHFAYKSGFKVGLGVNFDYDHWDTFTEYTWFHGTTDTGISALTVPFSLGSGQVILASQGHPSTATDDLFFASANQTWNLKMDFLDMSMARSYYSGTKLIFRPFVGARAAWIRQKEFISYNGSSEQVSTPEGGQSVQTVLNKTVSQGLGPRAGFETKWQVGYGFRLIGNGSADILYTRYNYTFKQQVTSIAGAGTPGQNVQIKENHNDFLRPHADFEMGFGWGSYFDNHNWFIDASATYGFQVFWDQNMFRNFTSVNFAHNNVPNGNLYIHGLTGTLRVDF